MTGEELVQLILALPPEKRKLPVVVTIGTDEEGTHHGFLAVAVRTASYKEVQDAEHPNVADLAG